MISLALAMALAHAEPALPSYREEIVVSAWRSLDEAITRACHWPKGAQGVGAPLSCRAEALDAALEKARAFERQVSPDARIRYLIGLALRHRGDVAGAERALTEAVALNADRAEAWFDLGELQASRGAWQKAEVSFAQVTALVPTGPRAWPGWFQRAQVAAHLGQAEPFERYLREALRYGFTFRIIQGQQAWREFWADERIQPTLDRMLAVYASAEVRDSLEPQPVAPD